MLFDAGFVTSLYIDIFVTSKWRQLYNTCTTALHPHGHVRLVLSLLWLCIACAHVSAVSGRVRWASSAHALPHCAQPTLHDVTGSDGHVTVAKFITGSDYRNKHRNRSSGINPSEQIGSAWFSKFQMTCIWAGEDKTPNEEDFSSSLFTKTNGPAFAVCVCVCVCMCACSTE